MNPDLTGVLCVLGFFALAILLANRPLTFGSLFAAGWFWMAWCAAEQGAPFGSLLMFLDGAALLWLCVYMHWQRGDFPERATP